MNGIQKKRNLVEKALINLIPKWVIGELQKDLKNKVKELEDQLTILNCSYSQEGEDLVLARFFQNKSNGFFVDVGAHHPHRFSNTFIFYQRGWRGINIDPNPDTITLFEKDRPRDINCNTGISETGEMLTYYMFNESALNTFNKELADEYCAIPEYHILNTRVIKTEKLSTVLDMFLPANTTIDFLSIDAEGLDFEVLQSNDWNRYKPTIVLVEFLNFEMDFFLDSKLYLFMVSLDYAFVAKTFNTVFFKKK